MNCAAMVSPVPRGMCYIEAYRDYERNEDMVGIAIVASAVSGILTLVAPPLGGVASGVFSLSSALYAAGSTPGKLDKVIASAVLQNGMEAFSQGAVTREAAIAMCEVSGRIGKGFGEMTVEVAISNMDTGGAHRAEVVANVAKGLDFTGRDYQAIRPACIRAADDGELQFEGSGDQDGDTSDDESDGPSDNT